MAYQLKEIYFTLQGEGARSGRNSVLCRFAGCNLWSGREQDREHAICSFCDTDFIGTDGNGGGSFATAETLAEAISRSWQKGAKGTDSKPYVVFTGGEPALQLDGAIIKAVKARGFEIAIETNGTKKLPNGIDWICVSPKQGFSQLEQRTGNELKLVYPQKTIQPEDFEHLPFDYFFLQPLDPVDKKQDKHKTIEQAMRYCEAHPQWKLSLQIHKIIGIP
ncbi:MAG: 7-carboxy-7-deazaguanine synthase [Parvibaculales bacterium]